MTWNHGLILIALLFSSGCSSTISSRIKDHQAQFESYPTEAQESIKNGDIARGMSEEMVYLAKGKPSQIENQDQNHHQVTLWFYYEPDYSASPGQPPGSLANPYGYPQIGEPIRPSGQVYQRRSLLIYFLDHQVMGWKE